jgi:hypothetical protein
MRAARPLLGEKTASGAVRVEVDGDNDSLKTYFMPAGGTTSAMGQTRPRRPGLARQEHPSKRTRRSARVASGSGQIRTFSPR